VPRHPREVGPAAVSLSVSDLQRRRAGGLSREPSVVACRHASPPLLRRMLWSRRLPSCAALARSGCSRSRCLRRSARPVVRIRPTERSAPIAALRSQRGFVALPGTADAVSMFMVERVATIRPQSLGRALSPMNRITGSTLLAASLFVCVTEAVRAGTATTSAIPPVVLQFSAPTADGRQRRSSTVVANNSVVNQSLIRTQRSRVTSRRSRELRVALPSGESLRRCCVLGSRQSQESQTATCVASPRSLSCSLEGRVSDAMLVGPPDDQTTVG
jgi:hypothetical protein